jgi:hypothetical protein
MHLPVFPELWSAGGVVVLPALPGEGVACAVTVGGGPGAAGPWLNCHVHDTVACVSAGCMKPTFPFTTGVLDPFAVAFSPGFGRDTSTTGNVHSKASAPIFPGIRGFPSIICR